MQLEEMKLLQLLASLRGNLPEDSLALQDCSEEVEEALTAFLRSDGRLIPSSHQALLH